MNFDKAFKHYLKKQELIQHQPNCETGKRLPYTPIEEAPCHCHEYSIFKSGFNAGLCMKLLKRHVNK
jgi:hypothetical protein